MISKDKILAETGKKIVYDMRRKLKQGRLPYGSKNASGKLSRSIRYKVVDGELVIKMASYARNVEDGRFPYGTGRGNRPNNRFPPITAIRTWTRQRGIPETAVYPIARSIAIKGIKPFEFIPDGEEIKRTQKNMFVQLSKAAVKEVVKEIKKI